jgi:metal-responsive CopG/Arc/MetJ family transcriptional regulator
MDDLNATRAAVQVRLSGPLYQRLEDWRRSRPKIPARSEALRELLERALAEQQAGAA